VGEREVVCGKVKFPKVTRRGPLQRTRACGRSREEGAEEVSRTRRLLSRRRSIVAAIGIAAMIWLWLRSRPEIDQRFIGDWTLVFAGISDVEWRLDSSGKVTSYSIPSRLATHLSPREIVQYEWRVHGNVLVFSSLNDQKDFLSHIRQEMEIIYHKLKGRPPYEERWNIVSVEPDRIVIQHKFGERATLLRVKE
jgi:hypothetical protein